MANQVKLNYYANNYSTINNDDMKQTIVIAIAALVFSGACKSAKVSNGKTGQSELNGTWQLEYISGPRIAFEGLYPDKKPFITFNTADSSFSGNTSCNSYRGKLQADDGKILFSDNMIMTRMACPGEGEQVFLNTMKKINQYAVQDRTLTFMMGDTSMMRFVKKQQ